MRMEILPKELYTNCDYDSLCVLLAHCQELAKVRGQGQIVSISLEIKSCDPLAVLQPIYEPQNLLFYFEQPVSDFAIAGAEAVVEASFSGPERFEKVRDFSRKVLENTVIIGDLDIPFSGPHFFSSFTFHDSLLGRNTFPSARVFLPRWQIARNGSVCSAVANVLVTPEEEISFLAQEVWDVYQKFNSVDYPEVPIIEDSKNVSSIEIGGLGWYESAVQTAKSLIDSGDCDKIVIARALDIESEKPFSPLTSLNRLRKSFPLCFSSFVTNGEGQGFISATPERLIKIEKGRVKTEALAGSIVRGSSEEEDVRLGKTLLESNKDLQEHQFVVDSIVARLQSLHISPDFESKPRLKKLANVQHLYTPIVADMPKDLHILDIASILYPTPAVCGTPQEASRKAIAKIENFDRGLYAGVLGWFDYHGDGELVVGIRSALIDGHKARLYAGCGIIKDSDPENERRETDIKLQAILKNLQ